MGVRKARSDTHALVEQTGNAYAYQFVRVGRSLVEVRALAGGKTVYTRVNASGKPLGKPRSAPSLKRADPRFVLAAAVAVGVAAELLL